MTKDEPTAGSRVSMKDALEDFGRAAATLVEVWEREDQTGELFIDGYPFDKCLREVTYDIFNWWAVQCRLRAKRN